MHTKIRKLTEGAVTVAIIGMILIINRLGLGLFEQYFSWLLPLPLLVYTSKYGIKDALVVYVSSLLLSFMLALLNTVAFVALTSFTGMIYGYGVYKNKDNQWLLGRTIFFTGMTYLLSMLVFAQFFGYDLFAEIAATKEMMIAMGIDAAFDIVDVGWVIAGMIATIAVLEAFLIHQLAHFLLPKINIKVKPLRKVIDVRIPTSTKLILSVMVIIKWVITVVEIPYQISQIFSMLGYISELIFCISGLIVIMIYSRVVKKQYIMMIVMILMLWQTKLVLTFLLVLGISDIIIDYRKHMMGWLKK